MVVFQEKELKITTKGGEAAIWKTLCLRREAFVSNSSKTVETAFIPEIYLQSMGK